jgi:iron complex outermembrane receptor protein
MLSLFSFSLAAQTLSGSIVSENGAPLSNVSITIPALQRISVSDNDGNFVFRKLPHGTYIVEFNLIGHKRETREVSVTTDDASMTISLKPTPLELPALTVTAEPQPAPILETPLATTVVEGRQLQRERGQSLVQTIEFAPGVAAFSGGPLSMKPVIRGLSAQRVLVLSGGVRLESQTWDEPQSPEINVLDVDRIEIVRGPNSVLYGSDALGGVVNVVKPELQSVSEGAPVLHGIFTANGFSNSPQVASGISLSGASSVWNYRGNFSARFADDYSTPAGKTADGHWVKSGSVFNSGGNEINGSAAIGTKQEWGTLALDVTHFGQKYFISPEPGRKEYELNINTGLYDSLPAAPSQEIFHETATLYANLPMPIARIELTGTYQRNSRKEEGVAETDADEQKKADLGIKPEAQLILNTLSFDAKAHHHAMGPFLGTVGVSTVYQMNETAGQNAIIPGFSAFSFAGYLYEELRVIHDLRFTGGLRFDSHRLHADANSQLGNSDQTLNFNAATGTAGLAWNVVEPLTFAVGAGRGWRAPVAAELFFKGSDEGAVRYKIGDNSLEPEVSLNVDVSARYSSSVLSAELSVFRNLIDRYIFLLPTGQKVDGLDSYRYKQADATINGGEISLQAKVADWCVVNGGADVLRGTNNETDTPLPLVPANRIRAGIRVQRGELGGVQNAYASVRSRYMFAQDRVGLFETPTPAYALFDIGAGGDVEFGSYRFTIDLSVENVLDKPYFDHLSRYKNYALNPGRNIELRFSVPFEIVK